MGAGEMQLPSSDIFCLTRFARAARRAVLGWAIFSSSLGLLLGSGCGVREGPDQARDVGRSDAGAAPPSPSKTPQDGSLRFEETKTDCGEVKEKLSRVFHFENIGKQPVHIGRIQPSCNCTGVKASLTQIPPGGLGGVSFDIDLEKQGRGSHQYTALVEYTDPQPHKVVLTLQAFNSPELEIVPRETWLVSYDSKSAAARLVILDYGKRPFAVTDITASAPWLHGRALNRPTVFSNGWAHEIEVSADGKDIPRDRHAEKVFVRTDDKQHSLLEIPVHVTTLDRVTVAPDCVRVWNRGPRGEMRASINIRDREGSSLAIESVESSCANIRVECEGAASSSSSYRTVGLEWSGANEGGAGQKALVTIKLREPCKKDILIGVVPPRS